MSDRPHLKLPPVLDLSTAAALKHEMAEALAQGGCVNVDASAVKRITAPCLQVLAAAAKEAAQAPGGRLRLHSMPQIMSTTIRTLGLMDALGMGAAP